MEPIDRLDWRSGQLFQAYGKTIGVRVSDADVLHHVRRVLPHCLVPTYGCEADLLYSIISGSGTHVDRIRKYCILYAGAALSARSLEIDEVLHRLRSDLDNSLPLIATDRVFLSAHLVEWNGEAVVAIGPGQKLVADNIIAIGGVLRSAA